MAAMLGAAVGRTGHGSVNLCRLQSMKFDGMTILAYANTCMGNEPQLKDVLFVGDSRRVIQGFPESVRGDVGHALHMAQQGLKHIDAKPMHGIIPAVMEIVADYSGNTFRAVYTVKLGSSIYVLHAFQKKAKKGIATPKEEIALIKQRLKAAMADAAQKGC